MSSEKTASAVNVLKGDLAAGWNLLEGSSADYTDLGVARRFGGAAAAYSLRDIGAMNGKVVNVRREPHDDDDPGVNDETDFSASQVQSGALEDWVNGKLENALPADVATAAAAYSLRKVKASYSGDAVRIRRSSDDIEVDVAFDSDDKVSASSAITNIAEQGGESGNTTATTVAEFLSEERTTFITNPVMTTVSGDITVLSNTTSSTEFTFTFSGSTGDGFVRHNGKPDNLGADIGDTVSFDITASGLSQQCGVRARRTGANNDAISPGINNIDNGTQTITFTVTSNGPVGYFAFVNLGSASTGTIRVHNLKVVGKSAFVHTWYDQAGSNNAVQDTDANQPKIAESGALLADGLDFDGSSSFLDATSALGATSTIGIFSVIKPDSTDNDGFILDNRDANDDGARLMQSEAGVGKYLFSMDSTDISLPDEGVKTTETLVTAIQSSTAATLFKNAAQVATAADDAISVTSAYRIGANRVTAGITFFDGTMKEIILFTSDQSANRFKIESNINNYYSLYNDELNFTSVVSPGTLPTAITTSDGTVEIGSTSQPITTNSKNSIKYNYNSGSYGTGNIFTRYMLDSGSDFIGLAQGDTIQVSLFVEELTSGVTLKLILNDNYTALSDESDISSVGFHSLTLTRNSTSGTEDNLQFKSLGLAGAVNISIKDIKVSRIARNGFVETWYDQSGGGFNMTQEQESLQPYRIQNGGTHDGLFAPRNTATSGNKVHMESLFRNQNFPANTTKLCYIVVGENFSANGSGNNKGTIFGAHRGVGNYIEGQHGLVVIATNKFGWQHGVTSNANDYQYIDLTTSGDNALETNKVLLIASINNTTGTISSNTQSSTATLTRNTGAAPADLSLAFGTATDSNLKYIRLFAPNRDNSFRAHNYAYGTIKEAILYANDHGNNLPAIKANINNHYQIYS